MNNFHLLSFKVCIDPLTHWGHSWLRKVIYYDPVMPKNLERKRLGQRMEDFYLIPIFTIALLYVPQQRRSLKSFSFPWQKWWKKMSLWVLFLPTGKANKQWKWESPTPSKIILRHTTSNILWFTHYLPLKTKSPFATYCLPLSLLPYHESKTINNPCK